MIRTFISVAILIFIFPRQTYADTIDVWMVKQNGKVIINSNQMEIIDGHPMQVHLDSLSDNDTLQIGYWTDSGMEDYKWVYTFKNSDKKEIDKFINEIDSSIKCFPTPCKTYSRRKNYIPFSVLELRQMMKKNNIDKIFVEIEYYEESWGKSYLDKPVCIITID